MTFRISRVSDTKDRLGESPLWDAASNALYWIDSLAGTLHRLDYATGQRRDYTVPAPIGSFALTTAGDAILALSDGFHRYDFTTGEARLLAPIRFSQENLRLNDGKADRQGRFLAGTMHLHLQPGETPLGGLYRLDGAGKATLLVEDLATTNGPCFSPDGRTFYCADSSRQVIWAFDYDPKTGTPSRKRVFADLKPLGTAPDGATVDAEGHVWTALVRSGQVGRFDPQGRLVRQIDMPAKHPTSLSFGGPDLDVLFVTSISASLRFTAKEEEAGWIFAIEGLGVAGLPERRIAL